MKKSFLTNLTFLIFVNLLVKPFWILGIDRGVQNALGAKEYGFYFALLNFSFIFNMVLDFGISNFNNRAVARKSSMLQQLLPAILPAKLVFALLYFALSWIVAWSIGFRGEQLYLLFFLMINQVIISFIFYFRSNLAALHFFKTDAVISVLDRLLMIGIVGIVLWGGLQQFSISIRFFVYAQTIAYFATAAIAFFVLQVKSGGFKVEFRFKQVKRILKLTWPYALLGVLMMIYNRIDGVMIERLLGTNGAREAGVYAASFRLLDVLNIVGFSFAAILLPMFSRMLKKKENVAALVSLSYRSILFIAIMVAVLSFRYSDQVMLLLYAAANPYWAKVFGYLMISFTGIATMYIFGSLLTANGNLKALNLIGAGGVLLNITLNFILIPGYMAFGAVMATVITQLIVASLHIAVAQKVFHFQIQYWQVLRVLLFIIAVVLIGWLLPQTGLWWIFEAIAISLSGLIVALILKVIDLKEISREFI
jgi:O-antigen/teichoic acid export membrane protein